jgi:hypothetical protein
MEIPEYLKNIITTPPWNYILFALAFVLGLAPKVLELGSGWQDIRSGRKQMQDEQQRLEILKLRYEIEALKAEHSLPTLESPPAKPVTVIQAARRESDRSPVPHWQRAYPRVTTAVLTVLQVLVGVFAGISGLLVIFSPFMRSGTATQPPISPKEATIYDIIYALMTWGFIVLYRSLGRRKRRIIASTTPQAPAATPVS